MYFSGEDGNNITIYDPINRCIRINPVILSKVENDLQQNVRVMLDTPLLRFRKREGVQEPASVKLVSKSDASVSLGVMPSRGPVINITNLLVTAVFKEMSTEEIKESYLAPLDNVIQASTFRTTYLVPTYIYPKGDPMHVEHDIQGYFNGFISPSHISLYDEIYGDHCMFGGNSMFRPPLYRRKIIEPDIFHLFNHATSTTFQSPEICFAIGDYKKGSYYLDTGFEELKVAITDYKLNTTNQRRSKSQKTPYLFPDGEWSSRVVFALVLRKYLLDAFLCGTDRVFISDHQNFSGFFQYEFRDDNEMTINYYVINDPETVAHGITLRSAMMGFFYKDVADASETKEKLAQYIEVAAKTVGPDLLENVEPRTAGKYSNKYTLKLPDIEDNSEGKEEEVIEGNTICRVIYDAAECYPSLGLILPSKVFVKLYHYSSRSWEMHDLMCRDIPNKDEYYDIFFNELIINEKISNSQYAANFPKLFASGYWNGLTNHPMHIFEYLGEVLPMEKWDNDNVYRVIKSRIKELHSLGIAHNDIRVPNIHVSLSGKVTLIDFGLSDLKNNEARKMRDFEHLDEIFEVDKYSTSKEMDRNKENDDNLPDIYGMDPFLRKENGDNIPGIYGMGPIPQKENDDNLPDF